VRGSGPAQLPGDALPAVWELLDGHPALLDRVTTTGPRTVLPSVFDVTGIASATVAAALLAVAELAAARGGAIGRPDAVPEVRLDRRAAAAAFRSEALLAPSGWELPPAWDPIAGDYRAADGWIRLHTNYAHHRAAALRALGIPDDGDVPGGDGGGGRAGLRDVVTVAAATLPAAEIEDRVVAEGGCAAAMHTLGEWAAHPHGRIALAEPAVAAAVEGAVDVPEALRTPAGDRPLAGVRVLDLTRVIAGPVATRTLAAWGADVVRVDPPGFAEVPALLPDTTVGKRRVALDLRDDGDRAAFERLVAGAHVVVHGLRPGALQALGYGAAALRELNPAIVRATVDAYGWHGPWGERRGFDSLVQMSCGIAAAGAAMSGADGPVPLPAQALDHGAGHLLAAGVCRALTRLLESGLPSDVWTSLVGVAGLLTPRLVPDGLEAPAPQWADADTIAVETGWGPARAVPAPGTVGGVLPLWTVPAGSLGSHDPQW
jgi:crotonobetainyl-CoA:carnitine CoA-transferase CaiB-like acyl-CoA transferase